MIFVTSLVADSPEYEPRIRVMARNEPRYEARRSTSVAYPGTSKSSKARLIETHTNSLKHLLAKDGVIYNTLGHDHCC